MLEDTATPLKFLMLATGLDDLTATLLHLNDTNPEFEAVATTGCTVKNALAEKVTDHASGPMRANDAMSCDS